MGNYKDSAKSGLPSIVPTEHVHFINDTMDENDELTVSDLKEALENKLGQEFVRYS